MDNLISFFFTTLKRGLVTFSFFALVIATLYIPNDWNKIPNAEAGGAAGGGATEWTQLRNEVELVGINVATTAAAASSAITSFATNSLWMKEMTLDGIAWAIAKQLVSSMVQSIVDWINSGFNGSPMFVQNIEAFLRDAADQALGEYIQDLGGLGSFICSPFRLDVQVAVALQYEMDRVDQPAPTCTLSGILQNIEGFLSGVQDSFSENGGWEAWFDITSAPAVYTPFGATIAAQIGAKARIVNAKGEEYSLLDFGNGFISNKVCDQVETTSGTEEQCRVSLPGSTIQDALSNNLDSSRQSLLTADEMNEIIAALFGQLANKLFSGTAGLLGLSAGTGHTYSGYDSGSYLGDMVEEGSDWSNQHALATIEEARSVQQEMINIATAYRPKLEEKSTATTTSETVAKEAEMAAEQATELITKSNINLNAIDAILAEYNAPTATETDKAMALNKYASLNLYKKQDVDSYITLWEKILIQN